LDLILRRRASAVSKDAAAEVKTIQPNSIRSRG
jgi:hypothetical protein